MGIKKYLKSDKGEAWLMCCSKVSKNFDPLWAIEARTYHVRQDLRCRLCKKKKKKAPETIQHIRARCNMLAGNVTTKQLTGFTGTSITSLTWELQGGTPAVVVMKYGAKILRDFQTQTKKVMMNQLDIMVVEKEENREPWEKNYTSYSQYTLSHYNWNTSGQIQTTNVKICYNIFLSCKRLSLCDKEHFPIKLVPRHDD